MAMVAAEAGAEAVVVGEEEEEDIAAVVVEETGKAAAVVEAAGKGAVEAAAHKVVANLAAVNSVAAARAAGKAGSQPHVAAAGTREVIEAPVRLVEVTRREACPGRARRAAPLMAHHNNPQGSIKLVAVEAAQTPAAIRRDPVLVDRAALQLAAAKQTAAIIRAPMAAEARTARINTPAVSTAAARKAALAITTTTTVAVRATAAAQVMVIDPRTWPAAPDRTVIPERHMAATPAATAAITADTTSIITADIRVITMAADIPSRTDIVRRITAVGITATGMAIGDIPGDFGRPAGIGAVAGDGASAGDLAPAFRSAFRSARRGLGVITLTTIHIGLRRSPCRSISTTRNRSS